MVRAYRVMHGKISRITHDGSGLFDQLPSPLEVMRYHSLLVETQLAARLSRDHCAVAEDDSTEIHALRHRTHPVWGVQFHPETILTQGGKQLLSNFLGLAAAFRSTHAPV